ncbi:MAG TPA: LacI family DNA-binding transcriptional regulator [Streptosporangiaceae bacterium]|nr:LacI family DNA-binding transcriptional regulator [Streptosporangiaceae bacterium]
MNDQPVTLKDVAAMAGVHPATVSRALNPETRPLVSDETADRITAVADSLGYRPNTVARSLRTRRSNTVGVLIPDLNNPLFPPIVRGIEDRLAADGYVALIGNTDADYERERLVFHLMRDRHVDGFVFATARLRSPVLDEAIAAGIPVVLVNRSAESYGLPSVSADNELGMSLAVDHLVALGHRRIAHVAGPQDISTGLSRYHGFVEAMKAHGLEVDTELVVTARAYSIDEGERCCLALLEAGHRPTAIAAANDMLAVGCYAALETAGCSCPADMSVVGFNDMPFMDRLTPALTSVSFPHYELGKEAGRLILEQIAGAERSAAMNYLAPELKVRGSTAPPAQAASGLGAEAD